MKTNPFLQTEKTIPPQEKRIRTMPRDFEETILTEEEMAYAIYDARCEKYFLKKELEEKAQKLKELKDCLTPFNALQLHAYVLQQYPQFKVDEQNEKIFKKLCEYFSNDPEFEKDGFSLSKGILLSGPVGVGKTELLRIFTKNKRQSFHLISVFEIEAYCQKRGVENFKTYTGMVPGWGNTVDYFYQKFIGWAFDDIGRESMVVDYGNKSDVVSKIIQSRYANKITTPFNTLHLTTNLTTIELEKRYDYAVKSRLREMFNYLPMEGNDRR